LQKFGSKRNVGGQGGETKQCILDMENTDKGLPLGMLLATSVGLSLGKAPDNRRFLKINNQGSHKKIKELVVINTHGSQEI
jgi:hypothetical protein